MRRIDMKKELMKLFSLDTRYNKKNEVNLLASSDVHLLIRPPPGVSYNVKGINLKGGHYTGKKAHFSVSKPDEQKQA